MNIYEGKLVSQNTKVGIVAARFNEFITSKLLSGAIDTLQRHDVKPEDIDVAWVPVLWKFLSLPPRWHRRVNMAALICLSAQSSAGTPLTTTMFAARFPRVLRRYL